MYVWQRCSEIDFTAISTSSAGSVAMARGFNRALKPYPLSMMPFGGTKGDGVQDWENETECLFRSSLVEDNARVLPALGGTIWATWVMAPKRRCTPSTRALQMLWDDSPRSDLVPRPSP